MEIDRNSSKVLLVLGLGPFDCYQAISGTATVNKPSFHSIDFPSEWGPPLLKTLIRLLSRGRSRGISVLPFGDQSRLK